MNRRMAHLLSGVDEGRGEEGNRTSQAPLQGNEDEELAK